MSFAIRVDKLSKRYRIQHSEESAQSASQTTGNRPSGPSRLPWRWLRRRRSHAEDFWALRDVSFELKQGDVLGLVGSNGAGKSTLLKILSRVTRPTSGEARIRGRVGSLLEVGTGFHPELTGRENVDLSGTILGMSRTEIARKFDEIIDFSGVEKFLDTPVKRYSSGMYVRLAFSVSVHLEPEILIVDEVLAVGDATFHEKCLKKMHEVAEHGRTILFVSHNMMAVQKLCEAAIWLEDGQIVDMGKAPDIVLKYLTAGAQATHSLESEVEWPNVENAPGNENVRIARACIRPSQGTPNDVVTMQSPTVVEIDFWNLIPETRLSVSLHFFTREGIIAFGTGSVESVGLGEPMPTGRYRATCLIPGDLLNAGILRVTAIFVRDGRKSIYVHDNLLSFSVVDDGNRRVGWYGKRPGVVCPLLKWSQESLSAEVSPNSEEST